MTTYSIGLFRIKHNRSLTNPLQTNHNWYNNVKNNKSKVYYSQLTILSYNKIKRRNNKKANNNKIKKKMNNNKNKKNNKIKMVHQFLESILLSKNLNLVTKINKIKQTQKW